jgi:hypothetical protein
VLSFSPYRKRIDHGDAASTESADVSLRRLKRERRDEREGPGAVRGISATMRALSASITDGRRAWTLADET